MSFPIAFRRGTIHGIEAKLDLPNWRRLSGQVSYSNMVGFGYTPVTGGLFLGDEASDALANTGRFAGLSGPAKYRSAPAFVIRLCRAPG